MSVLDDLRLLIGPIYSNIQAINPSCLAGIDLQPISFQVTELFMFSAKNKSLEQSTLSIINNDLKNYFVDKSYGIYSSSFVKSHKERVQQINEIINNLIQLPKEEYDQLFTELLTSQNTVEQVQPCIFIGHGRSPLWGRVNSWLKDNLKFNNVIYFESECRAGHHVGNILQGFLDNATFAIILMTAEDEAAVDQIRARQNVIHEIGLFQGKLGFNKVAILKQEGVEPFSNIDGLQYLPFAGDNISQTFWELQEMLKREGLLK